MTKYIMRSVSRNVLSGILLWTLVLMLATWVTESLHAGSKYGRAMTTVQYDNAHTGWNQDEDILTTGNVNRDTFGKIWTADLDGQIYGAPLYVSGATIGDQKYNVVYVGTENNIIYALDAESGKELWSYSFDPPGSASLLGCSSPPCGSIRPNIGITGTPVIDLETKTLYAVGLTRQANDVQIFKMVAVDIETGKPRLGWPVPIDPPDADFPIDTGSNSDRGALLLANGMVYVPFGGYAGDFGPYYGWVVGVDTSDPTKQISYHTPSVDQHGRTIRGAGIWASGGIAADKDGNIYAVTGNSFGAGDRDVDYSNAVIRLGPDLSFSEKPGDFFMPSNWAFLNSRDIDLGSSAPLLLPPQDGSNTPNLIFITGKWGVGHLIDRDNLGGVAQGDGTNGEGVYSTKVFDRAFSTAAYYEDADVGPVIFLAGRGTQPDCGTSSGVVALGLVLDDTGNSSYQTLWCTPSMSTAMSPVVTSTPGKTGILWVVAMGGTLFAFNAATGEQLYSDSLGSSTRNFLHFTAIDGKVFVGNAADQVVAYGLLK